MDRMGRFPICLNILLKKLSNIDLLHVIKLTKSSNNGENNLKVFDCTVLLEMQSKVYIIAA